ncbi:MAG: helix-turn-helix transcriptional regulator [Cyanobacteriota bacterium]|nr:helix-turn-helix transcriptional regulator [Cyanobacteriota bacterium]
MPMRNKVGEFLDSQGISVYRMIRDAQISDTTGYKLAADAAYLPSGKVLEAICKAYNVQPGELLEWIPEET